MESLGFFELDYHQLSLLSMYKSVSLYYQMKAFISESQVC